MRDIANPPSPKLGLNFVSRYHVSSTPVKIVANASPKPPAGSASSRTKTAPRRTGPGKARIVLESVEGVCEVNEGDELEVGGDKKREVPQLNLSVPLQTNSPSQKLPKNPLMSLLLGLSSMREGGPGLFEDTTDLTDADVADAKSQFFPSVNSAALYTNLTKKDLKSVQLLKLKLNWVRLTTTTLVTLRLRDVFERNRAARVLQKFHKFNLFNMERNAAANRLIRVWREKSNLRLKVKAVDSLVGFLRPPVPVKKWWLLASKILRSVRRLQAFFRGYLRCTRERIKVLEMLWYVAERRLISTRESQSSEDRRKMGLAFGSSRSGRRDNDNDNNNNDDDDDDNDDKKSRKKKKKKKKKMKKTGEKKKRAAEPADEVQVQDKAFQVIDAEPVTSPYTSSKTGVSSWYIPSRSPPLPPVLFHTSPHPLRQTFHLHLLNFCRRLSTSKVEDGGKPFMKLYGTECTHVRFNTAVNTALRQTNNTRLSKNKST
ncbi:hypothetical protein TrVE_jg11571 [Triparma verrucosa]|uniref:Uncharacterized protein n=1 Tax=Triparma verrucosa TaxID=1606542 RepID=A0A9W7EQV1_9STRA|nr:hypothetical protein TrVE_jg11571 [Triparma verrucosa]